MNGPSLTDTIARCHRQLDELFLYHQEALLEGRFAEALVLLDCYKSPHDLHKALEDEQLLPRHAGLGDGVRWPTSLYGHEHDRIGRLLSKLEERLHGAAEQHLGGRARRRAIIALLEQEKTLKGVVEHHQEREEQGLLPELDRLADTAWRAAVLAPFTAAWDTAMAECRTITDELCAGDEDHPGGR